MRAPKLQDNEYYWDPPDKEWLEYQYVTLNKTGREISDEFGPTRPTVIEWVRVAGIPVRPSYVRSGRGTSDRQARDRAMFKLWSSGAPRNCASCGVGEGTPKGRMLVHHKDLDKFNEDIENLEFMCDSCHIKLHQPWKGGD